MLGGSRSGRGKGFDKDTIFEVISTNKQLAVITTEIVIQIT